MPFGWRLAALLAGALSLGLSFAHLLGLPTRLGWTPELWLAVTGSGSRYALTGPAAALLDVAAILICAVLARLERDLPSFAWTAAAAGLFSASLIAWTLLVLPMTEIMSSWPDGRVASDFPIVRNQWETGHAAMAVLKLGAFAALAVGQLGREHGSERTPTEHGRAFRRRTGLRRTSLPR